MTDLFPVDHEALSDLWAATGNDKDFTARLRDAVTIAKCGGIDERTLETLLHLANAQQITPTLATKLRDVGIDITDRGAPLARTTEGGFTYAPIPVPPARTAADLTPADVGTDITLTGDGWSVSGPLRAVHTDTEYVEEQSFADPEPVRFPTRTTTTVTVGPWTATLTQPGTVTVKDTRP